MESWLSIKKIKALCQQGSISIHEVIKQSQQKIQAHNPTLNAVLEVFEESTINQELSGKNTLGNTPGLLKNNICQKGRITSCGSKLLAHYKAPYDATIKTLLEARGGTIIGRTNCDEFAMGASGEYSAFGPTKNPWDLARVAGGSSSGTAAAVAAGLVPWGIGTETGGSIRQPASFCGLVGLFPSYGLFSRYGLVAFGSSLDQPGPLTRTVYDNALVSSAMTGHDAKDSTSLPEPSKDFTELLDGKLPKNLKIGIISDALETEGIDPEIQKAFLQGVKELENLGAKVSVINLPKLRYSISVYFIITRAEAASNLSRFDGTLYGNRRPEHPRDLEEMIMQTRSEGFGPEVKQRIILGNYILSNENKGVLYSKAQAIRQMIRCELDHAFSQVDLLISPTTTTLPFKLGQGTQDPMKMYMADYFTLPNCVAQMPALTVPMGFSKEGLPMGIQFIGPRLSEHLLYQVGYAYEQATNFYEKTPPLFS